MLRMLSIAAAILVYCPTLLAATVSLTAKPGNGTAALTWTVSNGSINAQEVYRDTDGTAAGRVRIASLSASARSFTDSGIANGMTYFYWVKIRQSSNNAWVDSPVAQATPNGSSTFWNLKGNL